MNVTGKKESLQAEQLEDRTKTYSEINDYYELDDKEPLRIPQSRD